MDPESLSEELLAEYEELYNYHSVDVNPTALVLTPENRELGRIEGYDRKGPFRYVEKLKELLDES